MKKLFTILCATILTCSLYAQKDAGTILVGVNSNLSFTSTSYPDIEEVKVNGVVVTEAASVDGTSNFAIGVEGGYFMMDNMAVTLGVGFGSAGDASTLGYSAGVRYYFGGIFPMVQYGGGSTTTTITTAAVAAQAAVVVGGVEITPAVAAVAASEEDVSVANGAIIFGAGYNWMLNDNIALEPMVTYSMNSVEGDATGTDIAVKIGFSLYF